jgi:LytS/YehU family sensor histidine kinase
MQTTCPVPPDLAPPHKEFSSGYLPVRTSTAGWWKALRTLLVVALVLSVLLNPSHLHSWSSFAVTYGITFAYAAGLWLANGTLVDYLNTRLSWGERPLRRLLITLACSITASIIVIVGLNVLILLAYHQPLRQLLSGAMYGQILVPLFVTIMISLFLHSRSFLHEWRAAAIRAERLEKESAVARLDSLRRQVDPHFLFNSLNALTSLVEENDPARAVRFIRQLSQVYRYVLDSQSQELVPLADEIRFAESYLFLQKTRLGDALAVEMPLPPPAQLSTFFLPPLALQLLLENTIKHNTAFQADPLHLRVTLDTAAHTLTVRNTLRPRRLAPGESSGLGLKNLVARYAFLTNKPLQIGEEGSEFVVTLPLLTM